MSKRLMTLEDCIGIERLNGGDWHAEKGLVCWASNHTGGVMVKNLKTGTETKYMAGGGGEGYARFSPDGKYVSFLSSLPGKGRQVCIADLASGEVNTALSMPSHGSGGTGCLNASSPTGGAANGMPKYSSHPSLTMPCTKPYSVATVRA